MGEKRKQLFQRYKGFISNWKFENKTVKYVIFKHKHENILIWLLKFNKMCIEMYIIFTPKLHAVNL